MQVIISSDLVSHDYHMIETGLTYWISCVVGVAHVCVESVCVMQSTSQIACCGIRASIASMIHQIALPAETKMENLHPVLVSYF